MFICKIKSQLLIAQYITTAQCVNIKYHLRKGMKTSSHQKNDLKTKLKGQPTHKQNHRT